MVEVLVEGSGTDEESAWVTRQLNSRQRNILATYAL
jgi:hypothetical protein